MIRRELLITYRHSKQSDLNMKAIENEIKFESQPAELSEPEDMAEDICFDAKCSALVFAEKLFIQRNNHGVIMDICKVFGNLELLE